MLPPVSERSVDHAQQLLLGGLIDPAGDPATQSQRPFPSASINRTPISFNASDRRAISALASASSGSWPPVLTPGRGRRQRVQRTLLGDLTHPHDPRAIDTGPLGRLHRRVLAAQQPDPHLILLRRRQKNRLRRRLPLLS